MNILWFGYDISDFMLFSNRAYYRMFETLNSQFWPLQFISFALGLLLIYFIFRQSALGNRIVAFILAGAWLFSGWFYIWKLYVNINWAAYWFVHLFMIQGTAFLVLAIFYKGIEFQRSFGFTSWLNFILLAYAILYIPTLGISVRGSILSAEVFGMTPTPTAFATLALLGMSKNRSRFLLQLIPLMWMVFATLVLYALSQHGRYI